MSVDNLIEAQPGYHQVNMVPSELKSTIQVEESVDESWNEVIQNLNVARNGAGFTLTRPCSVGRLVNLTMPLAPELRAYDKDEDLYSVMAIVQYCNAATFDGQTVYRVGVAFVGKDVPESFKADPTQSYRINGMKKDGLWEINEAKLQFKNRKHTRYWISLPVTISLLHKGKREETVTKNISAGGASAVCSLNAKVGDKVKFACEELRFYSMAIVRNRRLHTEAVPTLHLEFIGNEFPMDKFLLTIGR